MFMAKMVVLASWVFITKFIKLHRLNIYSFLYPDEEILKIIDIGKYALYFFQYYFVLVSGVQHSG